MGPPSVQFLLSMTGRAGGIIGPGVADDAYGLHNARAEGILFHMHTDVTDRVTTRMHGLHTCAASPAHGR